MPCNDCSRTENCPPCANGCAHESWEVRSQWRDTETAGWWQSRRCADCGQALGVVQVGEAHDFEGPTQEPPPTPEEEEEAAPEGPPCSEVEGCDGQCCQRADVPPQPLRRPPYAVAYSVSGHAYEIALPGDATIRAVDGALIITHSLGPVAGIVQARPLEGEQSA